MIRPPRGRKRFQGNTEGTAGSTSLSNAGSSNGRSLRRKYMMYGAAVLVLLVAVIVLATNGKGNSKGSGGSNSNSGGGGGGGGEPTKTGSTSGKGTGFHSDAHSYLEGVDAQVGLLTHTKSGLKVITMEPKDQTQDATFGISFRTLPNNNRGLAHIVEHAILSGSENYPVKDPFNQLKRGSLQTFMDTWTSKDRTAFVFSSRNKSDFSNGVKVFLDAVFNPLMLQLENAWIFRQEGWRLELVDNERLYLSGNAFNEAKAAQMHPNFSMMDYVYKTLFQGHTYGFNARGDMKDVVSATHKQAIRFYNKFYHPSNGHAFCYGPKAYIDACLNLIDPVVSVYDFDQKFRDNSKVGWKDLQPMYSLLDKIPYPSYEDSNDFRVARAWVLNDQNMDSRTEVAWMLIHELLVGSNTAQLARTILELGLGDDSIGILENSLRQWVLIVGATGLRDSAQVNMVRKAIDDKLKFLSENGFTKSALAAAMNKMEMKFLDQSDSSMPQGVKAFQRVLSKTTYDNDPRDALLYHKAFRELREEIDRDGQEFLVELVTKRLIDSQHVITAELFPSSVYADTFKDQERAWLDNLDKFVTKEQGLKMLGETKDLKRIQEEGDSEEALRTIPRLSISDLDKKAIQIPIREERDVHDSGITMLEHELPSTNGIAYVEFAVDMSDIDFDEVALIPLFCQMLMKSGSHQMNDVTYSREIDGKTGGLSVVPIVEAVFETHSKGGYVVPDGRHMVTKVVVRSSCHVEKGCTGMFDLIKHSVFDAFVNNKKKTIDLMLKMIDDMEDDIQTNGHFYTTLRIESQYSVPGYVREQWHGVSQLMALRRTLVEARDDYTQVGQRLVLMQDVITRGNRNGMLLSVTGDKESLQGIGDSIRDFARGTLPPASQSQAFPNFAETDHPWYKRGWESVLTDPGALTDSEAFIIPTRVNHVGKGGIMYDPGEHVSGSDSVAMQFLGGYYLYDQLRFSLGAKEAWATLDIDSGSVVYQSDHDPNIAETLEVYENGASWLWDQVNGRTDLPVEAEGAVIGAIGTMDGSALQPSLAGYTSMIQYLKQDTASSRQVWRDEILGTSVDDFLKMVERLGAWGRTRVAVVTSEDQYQQSTEKGLSMTTCDYTSLTCTPESNR